MKRLLYIFPILIASCGQKSHQDKKTSSEDSTESVAELLVQNSDTSEIIEKTTELSSLPDIETFKAFALNYSPTRKPNSGVALLPEPPDSVLSALSLIKTSQPNDFEKYLTLIFIKLYSAHLECCNQSYEIRRQKPGHLDKEKDPLVYEFNDLAKKYPDHKPIEFISSRIGYDYVKANSHLLEFEPINKHVEIIEQIHKNVESGEYWK